jgi:hypothetical protein
LEKTPNTWRPAGRRRASRNSGTLESKWKKKDLEWSTMTDTVKINKHDQPVDWDGQSWVCYKVMMMLGLEEKDLVDNAEGTKTVTDTLQFTREFNLGFAVRNPVWSMTAGTRELKAARATYGRRHADDARDTRPQWGRRTRTSSAARRRGAERGEGTPRNHGVTRDHQ